MAQLRTRQIQVEATGCTDPERLAALNAEMRVIYDSMVELRREQIMERLEPAEPKRRWWRFWR